METNCWQKLPSARSFPGLETKDIQPTQQPGEKNMLVLQPERHILGLTVLLTVGQPQELHHSWEGEKSNQTFRIYLLAPRSHNSHSGRAAPASSNKAAQRYQKNVMEELFLPTVKAKTQKMWMLQKLKKAPLRISLSLEDAATTEYFFFC